MCGLPVVIREFVVYQDPTGCLTAFRFNPFEVRDDSNPSGDGLPHLSRIKLGGAATQGGLRRDGSSTWTSGRSRSAVGVVGVEEEDVGETWCSVGFAGKKPGSLVTSRGNSGLLWIGGGVRWRKSSPERRGALGRETAVAAGFLGSRRKKERKEWTRRA